MICRYFRVARRDMVYLKFILEAYEGMNVMSTVDNTAGIIRIAIMSGFEAEMEALLAELGKKVTMTPVEWDSDSCISTRQGLNEGPESCAVPKCSVPSVP